MKSSWMCEKCQRSPVAELGDQLCPQCQAATAFNEATEQQQNPDRRTLALDNARTLLEHSLNQDNPERAVAAALQGLLVCHIEQLEAAGDGVIPGGFVLPGEMPSPQPEVGPKPWG